MTGDRKQLVLRIDPAVHDAVSRWAADELRSVNAQIEMVLRRALKDAGRMPSAVDPIPRRGRPRVSDRSPDSTAPRPADPAVHGHS